MTKFIDDKIVHKESDIEKIQAKPNMYISYLGPRGSLHLSKEGINNAIDECINALSPGNEISVFLDGIEGTIHISDNGRGIPFDSMMKVCTKLQAGSKMTRENSGSSAGENGTGLTAVNALSEIFEIVVRRYGEEASIKFEKGKLVHDVKIKKIKSDDHGTTLIFKPNKFYMGKDAVIPVHELHEWIENISHLIPKDIIINFGASGKGKESTYNKKFKNVNGLVDYAKKKFSGKGSISPIGCKNGLRIIEVIPVSEIVNGIEKSYNKDVERAIGLEFAFTYNSNSSELKIDSFCNFVNTVDNGVHADAVKNGITSFLLRKSKDAMTEREMKSFDIISSDIHRGLSLVLNVATDLQPHFTGQTKEKVSNEALMQPVRQLTVQSLNAYFKENTKELNKIIQIIKNNAKVRSSSEKIRNSVIKGETNSLDDHESKHLIPANNTGKGEYREIYLIEGHSARGTANLGKYDNDTQALFSFKGVPKSTFDSSIDEALSNEEFKQLIIALKCNIGERFDITKLHYNKIIIMADADIDGFRITSAICSFFLKHLRPLVEQGYVYKVVTPLYKIKDRKKSFILDRREYIKIFEERIRDNFKVTPVGRKEALTNSEMQEFLSLNRDYLEELERLSKSYSIDKNIIEFLAITLDSKDFDRKLRSAFPELKVEDGLLTGVYEGRYQILRIDKLFRKKMSVFHDMVHRNKNMIFFNVYEKVKKSYDNRGIMTIGKFLTVAHKYQPEILMRYKGLGELDPAELRDTAMNPNNRILLRFTVRDMEEEMRKFNIIHGDKTTKEKRELMLNYKISREDLDN